MIRWLWNKMMKWGWDFNHNIRGQDEPIATLEGANPNRMEPTVRIGVINTMNGTVLEIGTYTPANRQGPDWSYQHFIVPEGKKLSEAITMFLLLKGLDK